MPCAAACETGALSVDNPAKMGTARVKALDCLAATSLTCTVCRERCPIPWVISQAPGKVPVIDPKACVGCGICQHVCPAPTNAILITPIGMEGAHAF